MTADKTNTERETVLRERAAFMAGSEWRLRVWQRALNVDHTQGEDEIAESRKRYPLKVTRPRIVTDAIGNQWRWMEGHLQFRRNAASVWLIASPPMIVEASRVAVRDVLSDPNEEVDA